PPRTVARTIPASPKATMVETCRSRTITAPPVCTRTRWTASTSRTCGASPPPCRDRTICHGQEGGGQPDSRAERRELRSFSSPPPPNYSSSVRLGICRTLAKSQPHSHREMLGVCDKAGDVVSRARGHFTRRSRACESKKPEGRRPRRGHHPRTQT